MKDSEDSISQTNLTTEELIRAVEILERVADDRGLLAELNKEDHQRLIQAAERVASPDRKSRKRLVRSIRKREQVEVTQQKADDERRLARTGIRTPLGTRQLKRPCPPAPFDPEFPPPTETTDENFIDRLDVARNCYICKREYDRIHFFYDALCPDCATLNWNRRERTCDLSGRYALLTGGRVKIGYQAVSQQFWIYLRSRRRHDYCWHELPRH